MPTLGGRGRGANTNVGTGQRLDVIDVEAGDDTIRVVKVGQRRLLYAQPGAIIEAPEAEEAATPHEDSVILKPLEGVTVNVSGTPCEVRNLQQMNSGLYARAMVYPGGASDENLTQWEVPVPFNLHETAPNVRVRLHILIPPSP